MSTREVEAVAALSSPTMVPRAGVRRAGQHRCDNPVAVLRVSLGGASRSTWMLAPFTSYSPSPWAWIRTARPCRAKSCTGPATSAVARDRPQPDRRVLLSLNIATEAASDCFGRPTIHSGHWVHPLVLCGAPDKSSTRAVNLGLLPGPPHAGYVATLGYTCGYAYLRSGSLRAPILIHWVTVVVWNLLFSGVYP